MNSIIKRDVRIDREDLSLTRFYLKSEDARAWAEDHEDEVTVISENGRPLIEVLHALAPELEDQMRGDCLSLS